MSPRFKEFCVRGHEMAIARVGQSCSECKRLTAGVKQHKRRHERWGLGPVPFETVVCDECVPVFRRKHGPQHRRLAVLAAPIVPMIHARLEAYGRQADVFEMHRTPRFGQTKTTAHLRQRGVAQFNTEYARRFQVHHDTASRDLRDARTHALISPIVADRMAIFFGYHPANIFPDWIIKTDEDAA